MERSVCAEAWGTGCSRPRFLAIVIGLAVAIVGVIVVLLVSSGNPTPTAAGLRLIPASAMSDMKARLGADGRKFISSMPQGSSTRSLTGAALLGHHRHMLHLEVRIQFTFHLKGKAPKGAPDTWVGATEDYSVDLGRRPDGRWQVTAVKLVPQPRSHVSG
jgi:hypothetical protein